MKTFPRILLCIIVLVCFLSSCSNSVSTKIIDENAVTEISYSKEEYKMVFDGELKIYKISRDVFDCFLNNQFHSILKENCESEHIYPADGEWYETSNIYRIPINDSLIQFFGDVEQLNAYLNDNGVNGVIKNMAMFDAPKTPLTLWLCVNDVVCYITINETPFEPYYSYNLYSHNDYVEKFGQKAGSLYVNGVIVETQYAPKIYYNYADVPLLCVLDGLGANIKQYNGKYFIKVNEESYVLNIDELTLYKRFKINKNLLTQVNGGRVFVYLVEDELMVDTATLHSILYNMGFEFELSINNDCIKITDQSKCPIEEQISTVL